MRKTLPFLTLACYKSSSQAVSSHFAPDTSTSQVSRTNRYDRYEAVRTLHRQAFSQREIARRLSLSRNTVRKFLRAETFPERSPRAYRASILDPYKPYILERWQAGCWNGSQLYSEVKARGYTDSVALFRLFISSRTQAASGSGKLDDP